MGDRKEKMEDWGQKIKDLAEKREISIRAFAEELGVSSTYLHKVVNGEKPASPLLKAKILDREVFEWGIEELIEILPEEVSKFILEKKRTKCPVTTSDLIIR